MNKHGDGEIDGKREWMVCVEGVWVDFPSFNLVQVGPKEVAGERV